MTTHELHARAQRLALRHAALSGSYQAALARQQSLTSDVSLAKGRLALNDELKRVFEALQARAHERSVGAFEKLLSALIDDVMPGEGEVRFIPKFRDSKTWLDIMIQKGDNLEDILDGNGGALTNIVSTGLRYAALSRTKNRSLMVLDEPDCWIKPSVVPAFIKVICDVANQTGVQTMFVSHYDDPDAFSNLANVIRLNRDANGNPVAEVVQPIYQNWTNNETPGIRKIELYNVRKHVSTVIPCFPGATAIVGDNNLGKSTAIATALRAVAYGESDDSLIHHDAQEAEIVIHLENEYRIEWSRARKRNRTVIYRLFQGESPEALRESYPPSRNSAPDWVCDMLGVSRVDDMDIQIGNQKVPVFLLNETASRRASLLSMGRESGHLASLMHEYEKVRQDDTDTTRRGERELVGLTALVTHLARVEPLEFVNEVIQEAAFELTTQVNQHAQLEQMVARLSAHELHLAATSKEAAVLELLPELPELTDTLSLGTYLQRLQRSVTLLDTLAIPKDVLLPELEPEDSLSSHIQAIERHTSRSQTLAPLAHLAPCDVPELDNLDSLTQTITRVESSLQRLHVLESAPLGVPEIPELAELCALERLLNEQTERMELTTKLTTELSQLSEQEHLAELALTDLKAHLGVCPLCESSFEQEHSHA